MYVGENVCVWVRAHTHTYVGIVKTYCNRKYKQYKRHMVKNFLSIPLSRYVPLWSNLYYQFFLCYLIYFFLLFIEKVAHPKVRVVHF